MLKTFDLRAREKPLTIYGPARPHAAPATRCEQVVGRTRYPLDVRRARPLRRGRVRRLRRALRSRTTTALQGVGYALVEDDRPGRFDPEEAVRLGVTPGPDFGRLQAGETVDGVDARAGDRGGPRRAPDRLLRRHRGRARRCSSTRARPTCSSTRRPSRTRSSTARGRPGTRTARQAAELARDAERAAARAHPPLHALLPARGPRRGPRDLPGHASSRATSTPSRSRSPSAAPRAGEAATARPDLAAAAANPPGRSAGEASTRSAAIRVDAAGSSRATSAPGPVGAGLIRSCGDRSPLTRSREARKEQ